MKHSIKITFILLTMFMVAQLIGLAVISSYAPHVQQVVDESGNLTNATIYNIPYGMEPPANVEPGVNLASIVVAILIAAVAMLFLMRFKAAIFLRIWFFFVVTIALAISINASLISIQNGTIIALAISVPLAAIKVFKRNIIIHNLTELLVYPGIAVIFVPLLNIWTMIILLIIISLYDIYAVWHAGFMQKMAKYQIKTLRLFSGFFVPYLGNKERKMLAQARISKNKTASKIKVNVAILGGGDVVFPIILAGVVLRSLGLLQALIISLGATIALGMLFYYSEKGKFYPAMPFITAGCFIALMLAYLI